jgi:tape measure domain-containing protein
MATIRTAIQLQDGVTSVMRNMNNAMNICISSFESLQNVSSHAVNTANLSAARAELNRASIALDNVEQNIREADVAQQKLNSQFKNGENAAQGLASKISTVVTGIVTAVGLTKTLNLSDTVAQTTARLDLMNDGTQTTAVLQEKIFQSAERSRGLYQNTADAVSKLGMQAKQAFSGNDELIAFTEQLNKTFVIAGASAVGVDSVMLQLTQSMAAGKLQGEELNAVLDNAQPIVANIQRYLQEVQGFPKSTTDNIKQLASDGVITAQIIKNAMFYAADETNRKFESMPRTFGQIWNSIQNNALMKFQPVLQMINGVANSRGFTAMVNATINGLTVLAGVAAKVFNEIAYVSGVVADNWSLLAPVVWGLVGAYVAYNAVSLVTRGIISAQAAIEGIRTVTTLAATNATFLQTVAQHGLNAALYACPITWIVVQVITLIAIFYLAVAAVNKLAGTSYSATGLIIGSFYVAGAVIANIFIGLWNTVMAIIVEFANAFLNLGNFIGNVFVDPVGAVVTLFTDMANTVLGILSGIAKTIDSIFGSKLSNAVNGWRTNLTATVETKFGDRYKKSKQFTSDQFSLNRIDYGTAWDSGYNLGSNVANKFSLSNLGAGMGNGLGQNVAGNIADTAANTGKMKDSLDITAEDLKYLRDIAEQEVINRFTTAEIHLTMSNNNTINSNVDLDGVVTYMKDTLIETMQVAAEKVHKD